MSESLSDKEEFLTSEVEFLEGKLAQKTQQLQNALETVQLLESVLHKASIISGHIPYLCATLTEGSAELEQASLQLQRILVHRQV